MTKSNFKKSVMMSSVLRHKKRHQNNVKRFSISALPNQQFWLRQC